MNPLSILIIDDEALARQRIRDLLMQEPEIEIVGECAGGQEALAAIRSHQPDLIFLDVKMVGLNGFDVLETLAPEECPIVIFVTAYDTYAVEAFSANALDYLLKPFSDERFAQALNRARQRVEERQTKPYQAHLQDLLEALKNQAVFSAFSDNKSAISMYADRLVLRVDGRLIFLPLEDVGWIAAEDVYVRVHTMGKKSYLLRESLSRIEQSLDPLQFVRIHRSTVVNVRQIKEIVPYFNGSAVVMLKEGTQLKLSRTYREKVHRLLGQA